MTKRDWWRAGVLLSALILGSCATFEERVTAVKKRASFDLDCPEQQLEFSQLSPHVVGVKGCGKRKSYTVKCDDGYACRDITTGDPVDNGILDDD